MSRAFSALLAGRGASPGATSGAVVTIPFELTGMGVALRVAAHMVADKAADVPHHDGRRDSQATRSSAAYFDYMGAGYRVRLDAFGLFGGLLRVVLFEDSSGEFVCASRPVQLSRQRPYFDESPSAYGLVAAELSRLAGVEVQPLLNHAAHLVIDALACRKVQVSFGGNCTPELSDALADDLAGPGSGARFKAYLVAERRTGLLSLRVESGPGEPLVCSSAPGRLDVLDLDQWPVVAAANGVASAVLSASKGDQA